MLLQMLPDKILASRHDPPAIAAFTRSLFSGIRKDQKYGKSVCRSTIRSMDQLWPRRGFDRPPLTPLFFGGGQERGLRPGTLPVPLVAGLGLAAELAYQHVDERAACGRAFRANLLEALKPLEPVINGDPNRTSPHVLNVSFPGVDSEAMMVALKDYVAISNGSACTSQSYQPSHVLEAMNLKKNEIKGAVRIS